ncbi:general odorant-binding protein 83a-like [Plodia interpunctella]|uniref:general odorant-binding protein 83a-like n=1 Tax=Plodia interpunctella TaxID=58824 RepID=UPI002368CDAB|nr:general odorant-binding protein 83a-like [Plodia interpunctella]
MYFIYFLCLVVAVSGIQAHNVQLSSTQKVKAHLYIMQCMKETGVKPDVLKDAKKGNFRDDDALKKFTLCFFQKAGIVDQDGKVNVDAALAKLPEEVDKAEAETLLDGCKKKTGIDAAETAFEVFKCYSRGSKSHIFL